MVVSLEFGYYNYTLNNKKNYHYPIDVSLLKGFTTKIVVLCV
jgi:hypothetical protein